MIIKRTPLISLRIACAYTGGQGKLADAIGLSQNAMHKWMKRGYASPEYVKKICEVTGGDVTPQDLRPDIF